MAIILKYVVPVLSVAVLVLCLLAAFLNRSQDQIVIDWHAFEGGLQTYFIAKRHILLRRVVFARKANGSGYEDSSITAAANC